MKLNKYGKPAGLFLLLLLPLLHITAQNNLIPSTQDCSSTRPPFAFTIREAWISSTTKKIDARYTPLVGDIDGDGNIEVFAANGATVVNGGILYVFEGRTGALAGQLNSPGIGTTYSHGAVIFKRNKTAKGTVFIAGRQPNAGAGQIYLYEVRDATRPLQFDLVWQKTLDVQKVVPVVADLNGDGNVEIIAGKYIIDANSGNVVSTLATGLNNAFLTTLEQAFPLVADVDGDGLPDVIVGANVYRFNTGFTNPTPTPWRTCPGYTTTTEGVNAAADINQDGVVDIVHVLAGTVKVWTPTTNTLIGQFSFPASNSVSYPFVGDMDTITVNGKRYPEICVNTASNLRAFSFNGTSFTQKWILPHTDTSGSTALTLFDFNLDGTVELVYRDESFLRIFDGSGNNPDTLYTRPCGSATIVETPIVADVTGDGSANIIVTGDPAIGAVRVVPGEVMVFEGLGSRWASCPKVWNQQLYSNLLVNEDLTIPTTVRQVNQIFTLPDSTKVQYYNGGPMQAPYISEDTYLPIDVSPDVYIVSGSITTISPTSVTVSVIVGNKGLALASANIPIRFYQNSITTGNLISSANTTLGDDLAPGQTTIVTQTINGLSPTWAALYVRALDDGANFPALGAFSDCDLTNNTKSFGTLELTKEVGEQTGCINNVRTFIVKLKNDGQATYPNIQLTDSLGSGWTFVSATPSAGTSVGSYNNVTRSIIWTIPSLAPGDSAVLLLQALVNASGSIRNYSWVNSVGGTPVQKDYKSAYVIVANSPAPAAPSISPVDTFRVCPPATSVQITASGLATSYQWYQDGVAIVGETSSTYTAITPGSYSATLFDGTCSSNRSDTLVVLFGGCLNAVDDHTQTLREVPVTIPVLENDSLATCPSLTPAIIAPLSTDGVATVVGTKIEFTPNAGFAGLAEVHYRITCGVNTDAATIYINVLNRPDNIIEADCYDTPPAIVFGIDTLARSDTEVSLLTSPVAGDIDGDGETEILVMNHPGGINATSQATNAIYIYGFNKSTNKLYRKYTISVQPHTTYPNSPLAIAKVDGNTYASIFYVSYPDRKLYRYDFNGTSWWSPWSTTYTTNPTYTLASPVIADIMGSGRTQVVVLNKVIDTNSGNIIADGDNVIGGMIPPLSGISPTYSFGRFGHAGPIAPNAYEASPVVIDIDNDGVQEVIGGDCVYGVNLVDFGNPHPNNTFTLKQRALKDIVHPEIGDGGTAVADMDNDGLLEVIVAAPYNNNLSSTYGVLYVYNPRTGDVIHSNKIDTIPRYISGGYYGPSRPFVGDFDNDGLPEIALVGINTLRSYKYDTIAHQLNQFWVLPTTYDTSGSTTLTVFNFAHDGKNRLVYRDETHLRIINGSTNPPVEETSFPKVESPTVNEFPVIVDINGDGAAEIIVTGRDKATPAWYFSGELRVYASNGEHWAPARKVWNQAAYNSVNVNEDLTIPRHPLSPATVFPGPDGILGNSNDVRPYNGFLMQQTMLDINGMPIWILPDIRPVWAIGNPTLDGDSVVITIGLTNQGDAAMFSPVHFSIYKDSVSPGTRIKNDSINVQIDTAETVVITYKVALASIQPSSKLFVRLNDKAGVFPFQPECDSLNNVSLYPLMKKNATLNSVQDNGTYPNPVAALYSEYIEYKIKTFNANLNGSTQLVIRDTLPPYLDFVSSIPAPTVSNTPAFSWTLSNLASMEDTTVTIVATPTYGVSASQPMLMNRAWVTVSDTVKIPTNFTYHQGAGVSIITFSAGYGGSIYNASQQALDYRTAPRTGVVIAPDEGYRFAGWSHADYLSLRGESIRAQNGIMYYDTLTIYGNVELHADFEPEMYPITYHLNGSENAEANPRSYTINSPDFVLLAPEKWRDEFIGWTGSNGDIPQLTVIIPAGSTGPRTYYANFRLSKRAKGSEPENLEDKIWAAENELYIKTIKPGSILRIYSMEGVLQKQQILLMAGETKTKLPSGLYLVTINNGIAKIVKIE